MNSKFIKSDETKFNRLTAITYNLDEKNQFEKSLQGNEKEIEVYGTNKKVKYDSEMRIGVGISKLGTSNAIALGAYTFALNQLSK